tara:strand:- start:5419 stop:6126 length:708 start_codon:yes stop_codon:yes gene_type:complete
MFSKALPVIVADIWMDSFTSKSNQSNNYQISPDRFASSRSGLSALDAFVTTRLINDPGGFAMEMDMTDARIQAMLDKDDIRSALIRYARGVDRLDAELIADLYHEDAVDHHGQFDMLGKDFAVMVVDFLRQNTPGGHQHRITNISIELDGDTAYTEAVLHSVHNNLTVLNEFFGRYIDRFERRNGVWKSAERWVLVDFTRATKITEHYAAGDEFIKGTRDKTDISWQRVDASVRS